MRPTAWVSFVAVFLLTAAVYNGYSTAQAKPGRGAGSTTVVKPSWVVVGGWMSTPEEAVQDALDKARLKVDDYLRAQDPPMEWSVDRTYLRNNLWIDLPATESEFKAQKWEQPEEKNFGHKAQVESGEFDGLGRMYRAAVAVRVSDKAREEFEKQEQIYQAKQRQDRAAHRQGVLARVLGGLVAFLAVVACYLRLEDATKGYYTTLLRLAALGLVALVGAGIWLLS